MFLAKKMTKPRVKRLTAYVSLTPDKGDVTDILSCRNVRFADGKLLSNHHTFGDRHDFDGLKKILAAGRTGAYVYADGKAYVQKGLMLNDKKIPSEQKLHSVAEYRGKFYYSSDKGLFVQTVFGYDKVADIDMTEMRVYDGHIVGFNFQYVFVSNVPDTNGTLEFDEIKLPTPVTDMACVGKTVYLIGDTVYALDLDCDITLAKVTAIGERFGNILPYTASAYNGRAVFGTDSGFFVINKDRISRTFEILDGCVKYTTCVGAFHDGEYFLSCKTRKGAPSTLCLDADSGKINRIANGYQQQIVSNDGEVVSREYISLRDLRYHEATRSMFYRHVDFDGNRTKHLRTLTIRTRFDIEVTVAADGDPRYILVKGSNKAQTFRVGGIGRDIYIQLSSTTQMEVSELSVTCETTEE